MSGQHSHKILLWAMEQGRKLPEALVEDIESAGSVQAVADKIGVRTKSIYDWLNRHNLEIRRTVKVVKVKKNVR